MKKQYFDPSQSRPTLNTLCTLKFYTALFLILYLLNVVFTALVYSDSLNIQAFRKVGAYCPRKMYFITLLELILSSVGLAYYMLSSCAVSSDVSLV